MHGSRDLQHKLPYYAVEDLKNEDFKEKSRFMHGSEDISHHHRWFQMLQALEAEEAERKRDERQEARQEAETSYW